MLCPRLTHQADCVQEEDDVLLGELLLTVSKAQYVERLTSHVYLLPGEPAGFKNESSPLSPTEDGIVEGLRER